MSHQHIRSFACGANLLAAACFLVSTQALAATSEGARRLAPEVASHAGSEGPHALATGKVYLSDSNSYTNPTEFWEYDCATDIWTQRASMPGSNTTQIATDEAGVVHALLEDGKIYAYDATGNSWSYVMDGPAASVGRNNIAVFSVHGGSWVWAKDGGTTLYYNNGSGWFSTAAPTSISCGSSVNRATGIVYVRTYGELGFFGFDPSTVSFPVTCSVGGSVGENSRVGAYWGGSFFTKEWSGPIMEYDVATCAATATGVTPASVHASNAVDPAGLIYYKDWGNTTFEAYAAAGGALSVLAGAPVIAGNAHETMTWTGGAFVGGLEVQLSNTPGEVPLGGVLTFRADAVNTGADDAAFDQADMIITGPALKTVPLYSGADIVVPGGSSLGTDVSLNVPGSAPLGAYNVEVAIYDDGTLIDSDDFDVDVVTD